MTVAQMFDFINVEQGSEEWKSVRRQFITATDASIFFGKHMQYKTLHALWLYKKTGKNRVFVSEAMKKGSREESKALNFLKSKTGIVFSPAVVKSKKYPFLASLDGLDFDCENIAEIKVAAKGQESPLWKQAEKGFVPEVYQYQVQMQLLVTGAKKCYFYVFDGEFNGVCVEIFPDPLIQEEIIKRSLEFYNNHMLNDQAPDDEVDECVRVDDEFVLRAKEFLELKSIEKDIKSRLEAVKKEITSMCGDAPITLGGGLKVSLSRKKSSDNLKELISDLLPEINLECLPEKYQGKLGKWSYRFDEKLDKPKNPAKSVKPAKSA